MVYSKLGVWILQPNTAVSFSFTLYQICLLYYLVFMTLFVVKGSVTNLIKCSQNSRINTDNSFILGCLRKGGWMHMIA